MINSNDPRNQEYNKYRKDPTSSVSQKGDKKISFNTVDAGKTYTKTVYKAVKDTRAERVGKRNPYARAGSNQIKREKTISAQKALRQANRLAKRPENQKNKNASEPKNQSAPKKQLMKKTTKVSSSAPKKQLIMKTTKVK